MFTAPPIHPSWLDELGLAARPRSSQGLSAHDERVATARASLIAEYVPDQFTRATPDGTPHVVDIAELASLAQDAERRVQDEIDAELQRVRDDGWHQIRAARARADADDLVVRGDWVGFTLGSALAWCWTLYQYEPKGFVLPGSALRSRNVRQLLDGDLPDGFDYAHRARALRDEGYSPESFRREREASGSPIFVEDAVRFGTASPDAEPQR